MISLQWIFVIQFVCIFVSQSLVVLEIWNKLILTGLHVQCKMHFKSIFQLTKNFTHFHVNRLVKLFPFVPSCPHYHKYCTHFKKCFLLLNYNNYLIDFLPEWKFSNIDKEIICARYEFQIFFWSSILDWYWLFRRQEQITQTYHLVVIELSW